MPVFAWTVVRCSSCWKPAAYAAEKQCRNCLRKIEAKHTVVSKAGTATVTASVGGRSAKVQVTVGAVGKQPVTVWYHPDASWTTVKANWRLESVPKTLGLNVDMAKVKDGWYRLTIPDTKGLKVAVTFTDMKRLDNNSNRNYVASGESVAVASGQLIADVTPNCAVTSKQ